MSTQPNKLNAAAWEAFLASLPPSTRDRMNKAGQDSLPVDAPREEVGEEQEAYDLFVSSMPASVREVMRRPSTVAPETEVEAAVARYGVVESTDGEWAKMRVFKTSEGLARRLQQLEGSDTIVWLFFGLPLGLTKGPQRYIMLPGGTQAIQVPLYEGGPCKVVDAELVASLATEDNGYLGPPELAETPPPEDDSEEKAATSADSDEDDDD